VTLVLGSLSTAPIVLSEAAEIIQATGLTDAAIEKAADAVREDLGEVTNLYSRAVYKKQLARVLVKRALEQLREETWPNTGCLLPSMTTCTSCWCPTARLCST
jgi:CO/xanthine dehydrogenase FAD-binding subunit